MNLPFPPLCLAACSAMTGLIWLVQLLVYPHFAAVPPGEWRAFHDRHTRRISYVVAPLMVAELGLGGLWLREARTPVAALNLAGVLALWAWTFLVSVPLHEQLSVLRAEGPGRQVLADKLVQTNWPRTLLWTCRAGLLLFVVLRGA